MASLRSAYATVTGWGSSPAGPSRAAAGAPVTATGGEAAATGSMPEAASPAAPPSLPSPSSPGPPAASSPGPPAAPAPAPPVPAQAPPESHAFPAAPGVTVTPATPAAASAPPVAPESPSVPLDLRGTAAHRTLVFPAGDRVVVSGLPGSGKSTLIRRVLALQNTVRRIDSQDVRERWAATLPGWLPYAVYRPLVRLAHYAGLRHALASGASVVVHDCGSQAWVRNWLGRDALRGGRVLHLVLLDVPPATALRSQAERGRTVSHYAFGRHRRAVRRLIADAEAGRLPRGCESVVLLDRSAAGALAGMAFE